MPPWGRVKRRELTAGLRALGFSGPFSGGKHEFSSSTISSRRLEAERGGGVGRAKADAEPSLAGSRVGNAPLGNPSEDSEGPGWSDDFMASPVGSRFRNAPVPGWNSIGRPAARSSGKIWTDSGYRARRRRSRGEGLAWRLPAAASGCRHSVWRRAFIFMRASRRARHRPGLAHPSDQGLNTGTAMWRT
jgi:hypothetical protein